MNSYKTKMVKTFADRMTSNVDLSALIAKNTNNTKYLVLDADYKVSLFKQNQPSKLQTLTHDKIEEQIKKRKTTKKKRKASKKIESVLEF